MQQMRIATWNIRKAIGLDRRRDPGRVLRGIAELRADIVVLQEADKRLWDRPSALPPARIPQETDLVPVPVANGRSLGWHGNAILAAREFEIEAVERIDLPGLEPRGALLTELSRAGTRIRIVGVHLGLVRRYRTLQLEVLVGLLAERAKVPTVILGDFNEWAPAGGLEPLAGAFRVHAPGKSYHAARPVAALDRIAHDRSLRLRSAGIHHCAHSARASDHLPVWAELELDA